METRSNILNKVPPQNLEAEQSLLGSILISKDAIIKIADIVKPDDFYKDHHAVIFDAILDLYEKKEPLDLLNLGNKLEEKGKLEEIGGRAYLTSLVNVVPSASHVVSYAKIVTKKATLRRLIDAATDVVGLGFNEEEDIEKTLDNAEQKLFSVSQKHLRQSFVPLRDILTETFERIDELHGEKGKLRGIPTGYSKLDNLLAGFQRSDLVILAARPSMGKTALALDFIRHIGVHNKIPIGIFSLEMSKEQLCDRLLCAEAGVDLWKMRTGRLAERPEDNDFERIGHAMGMLAESPIYIDDSANATVMEIRTKARRLQSEHGLGMVIVDYLQLMEGSTARYSENRVQEIAEISRSLKGLARELNIPVLALSQLSRMVESRKPAIPKLSDLRESGALEQDADVVMFIYRKSMDRQFQNISEDEKNIAEIHIAKHRNGPTGLVKMFFDEKRVSFKNLENEEVMPIEN